MKVYFPVQDFEPNRSEVVASLKSIFERQFSGYKTDPLFSLTYDREDQFFLKSSSAVFWAKVFFEPFTVAKAENLKREHEALSKNLQYQVQLNVFFLQGELDPEEILSYPLADYFQYSFIQALGEKAMKVERLSFIGNFTQPKKAEFNEALFLSDYSFSKQSQLTRNELAELIDLSLDLKRA